MSQKIGLTADEWSFIDEMIGRHPSARSEIALTLRRCITGALDLARTAKGLGVHIERADAEVRVLDLAQRMVKRRAEEAAGGRRSGEMRAAKSTHRSPSALARDPEAARFVARVLASLTADLGTRALYKRLREDSALPELAMLRSRDLQVLVAAARRLITCA